MSATTNIKHILHSNHGKTRLPTEVLTNTAELAKLADIAFVLEQLNTAMPFYFISYWHERTAEDCVQTGEIGNN